MKGLSYYSAVIFVKDILSAKKFYTEILDCKIEHDFGKNVNFSGGLSIWEIDKNHIIPSRLDEIPDYGNRFELYFETENISSVFARLKKEGIRFLHEINEESWGQFTIRFFDPDGHLIEIGESMTTFINRWYNSGMTMEQVSFKTGVPIKTISELISV